MTTASGRADNGAARLVARIVAGVALAAALAAVLDLGSEYQVWRYQEAVASQDLALARGDRTAIDVDGADDTIGSPRAQLYRALLFARAGQAEEDPARRARLLARAAAAIALTERGRPQWGEALAVDAYIRSIGNRAPATDRAVAVLAQSYRYTPFLRDAGAWRARTAFAVWDRLDARTRAMAVEEAVWISRLSASVRPEMFDAARASPAYDAFSVRWIENRRNDADLAAAHQRAAP